MGGCTGSSSLSKGVGTLGGVVWLFEKGARAVRKIFEKQQWPPY